MPLIKGGGRPEFEANMHELKHAAKKRPLKQRLAISFKELREGGGDAPKSKRMPRHVRAKRER